MSKAGTRRLPMLLNRFGDIARILVLAYVLLGVFSTWLDVTQPSPWWAWLLMLVPLIGAAVALWWPVAGFLLACGLMAAEALLPGSVSWFTHWLVATVSVVATARARVVVAACGFGVAEMVVLQVLTHDPYLPPGLLLMGLMASVGLAIRLIQRQHRARAHQITAVTHSVVEVRRAERRQLASELSSQLRRAFWNTATLLTESRDITDPAGLREQLNAVADEARSSLARLRRLVGTLRRTDARGEIAPSRDLRLMLDDVEDELAVHAYWVETSLSGVDCLTPAERDAVARCLMTASEHVRLHAPPGSRCEFAVTTSPRGSTVRVTHELSEAGPHEDPDALSAGGPAAGDYVVSRTHDRWKLLATLPRTSSGSGRSAPSASAPSEHGSSSLPILRAVQIVRMLALLSVVWALWSLSRGGDPVTAWLVAALGLSITATARLPGLSVLLATAVLLVSSFTPEPNRLIVPLASMTLLALVPLWRPRWLLPMALGNILLFAVRPEIGGLTGVQMVPFIVPGVLLGLTTRHLQATHQRHQAELFRLQRERETVRIKERQGLARDLHDVLAHHLSAMTLEVERLRGCATLTDLEAVRVQLGVRHHAAQDDLRSLLALMDGAKTQAGSSVDAPDVLTLTRELTSTLSAAGHSVSCSVTPGIETSDPSTLRSLERILQEASTNIIRYAARGKPCSLAIVGEPDRVDITVTNTIPRQPRTQLDSTGYGLLGLRERVSLTGGSLTAGPRDGLWVLRATLPREHVRLQLHAPGQSAGVS